MKRRWTLADWTLPILMTLLCASFAGWIAVAFGLEALIAAALMMPFPMLVLWLSWEDRLLFGKHPRSPAPSNAMDRVVPLRPRSTRAPRPANAHRDATTSP